MWDSLTSCRSSLDDLAWNFFFFFAFTPRELPRKGFFVLAWFLERVRLTWQVESQRYFVYRGCWKTGTGERSEFMPLTYRCFQYELRLHYWVSGNLHGAGRRRNWKPGSACFLAMEWVDWQGIYIALLKVPLCLRRWQQVFFKQNLMDGWIFLWLEKVQTCSCSLSAPWALIWQPVLFSTALVRSGSHSGCEVSFPMQRFGEALGRLELVLQSSSVR